jgi:fructokinase
MPTPTTIVCFGEALWDEKPDGRTPGGAPMNVALRLSRLDADVRFVSRVGRDEAGSALLDYIASAGLPIRDVQLDALHATGRVLVDVTNPHEARYTIVEPAAWDFIGHENNSGTLGDECEVVVYGSLAARHATSRATLHRLLDAARIKVFDVNLRPPFIERGVIEPLLERANWAKLNADELQAIAGWHGWRGELEALCRQVAARYAIEVLCVTLGAHGAAMLRAERFYRQPGFSVPVVDTIGCGDSFLASWLFDMLRGAEAERALRRACALGALVAGEAGANPAIDPARVAALAGP